MTTPRAFTLAGLALAACSPAAGAQGLASRIGATRDGLVGIQFAARNDVCGFGTSYLRIGTGPFAAEGTWITSSGEFSGSGQCERGPVRVLITRSDGRTVGLRTGIGGGPWPAGTTDLGPVGTAAAADFFFGVAAEADGRLGRDALLPPVLADSVPAWRGLLTLARNRALSRGLRESAVAWLGREAATSGAAGEIVAALGQLAGDRDEPASVRSRAVGSLARAEGLGTAALIPLAEAQDPVVSRAAFQALGRSADPRAREVLRRRVRDGALTASARTEAIRALGGRDATPGDYALLRELWPGLTESGHREAVVNALAEAGGAENLRWLLAQAADPAETGANRARAVKGAVRAGARTEDLVRLYDQAPDRGVKQALLESLLQIGDRAAVDKVMAIARSETDVTVRRNAINRLARSGDARAAALLKDLVDR